MTQRKPVKKAAKKVVKKPTANEVVIRSLSSGVSYISNKLSETRIDVSELRDEVIACKELVAAAEIKKNELREMVYNIQIRTFMFEARLDAHDKLYNEISEIKTSIWWTRFWLALTITAFVAYAIITA